MGLNLTGRGNTQQYQLGRGRVYAAEINSTTGKAKAYRFLGNATAFTASQEVETLDHVSSQEGLRQVDLSLVTQQQTNLALTLDEINFQNLSLFFTGEYETITNPGATDGTNDNWIDTAVDAEGVRLAHWYDLVKADGSRIYDITAAGDLVLEADPTGVPVVLVEGTDYELDLEFGRVFFLATAVNVAAGDEVGFAYTANVVTAPVATIDEVRGLTETTITTAIKFLAENPAADGKRSEFEFHQVKLRPEGDFALIGDEFTTMGFTGVAERNETGYPDSPVVTIRDFAGS